MIDNSSIGSLCIEAQLKSYHSFTGYSTSERQLVNHYAIIFSDGSKRIGITTVKFLYNNSIIEFDAPIIENSDISLNLGLDDQDTLKYPGANLRDGRITFFDSSPMLFAAGIEVIC